ncbi:MAG: hypothetical protein HQ581_00475 [Planctomycetes bacterium]|nr:hypothetical protein [Planctomycetota bacterium]
MKPRIGTLALAVFLLLALALGARLARVAAHLETGPETLALSWRGATLGQVGYPRIPLRERPPTDQADFWLAEVDRIFAEREPTAEMLMGAAWVLDGQARPAPYDYLSPARLAEGVPFPPGENRLDGQISEPFDVKCSARCLQLAAAATELEPDNVGFWRMRALLLFRFWTFGDAQDKRCTDWLAQLDECVRHDPENALYDYLAATKLWDGNVRSEFRDDGAVLHVDDPQQFAEGNARFERGLKNQYFAVGAAALPCAAKFLRNTELPLIEQTDVAMGLCVNGRAMDLLRTLNLGLSDRATVREWKGDWTAAAALHAQSRQVARQVDVNDWPIFYVEARGWGQSAVELLLVASETGSDQMPAEGLEELQRQREILRVEHDVIWSVIEQLGTSVDADLIRRNEHQDVAAVVPALVMAGTLKLAVTLIVLGAIGLILSWGLNWGKRSSHHLGPLRHATAWTVAGGGTFLSLGLWQAGGFDEPATAMATTATVWLLAMAAMVLLFRKTVQLCRHWARRPADAPVVPMILVATLWQVTVAAPLTITRGLEIRQHVLAGVYLWLWRVPDIIWLALAAVAVVAVGVWIWSVFRYRRRMGHLPRAQFVAIGILLPLLFLVLATFDVCADFMTLDPRSDGPPLGDYVDWVFSRDREPLWGWAFMFWIGCAGVSAGTIGAFLIAGVWFSARHYKKHANGDPGMGGWRAYCGGLLGCLGRSSLAAATVCLLIYLAIAPGVLRTIEDNHHWRTAFLADPPAHWAEFRDAVEAIEADPDQMAQIRAEVAEEIRIEESWNDPDPMTPESE